MAEFPALVLWTDAYLADTQHLTTEQHGAYFLLLLAAWRSPDCSLPSDDKTLCKFAHCTMKKWQRLRTVVMAFWVCGQNGRWTQKRLSRERRHRVQVSKKRKISASKGVAARQSNGMNGHTKPLLNNNTNQANGLASAVPPSHPFAASPKDLPKDPSQISNYPQRANGTNGHDHGPKNGIDLDLNPLRASRAFRKGEPSKSEKFILWEQRTLRFVLVHWSRDAYTEMVRLQLSEAIGDQHRRKELFNTAHQDYEARKAAGTLQPMD